MNPKSDAPSKAIIDKLTNGTWVLSIQFPAVESRAAALDLLGIVEKRLLNA